jgi:hypothetical protein
MSATAGPAIDAETNAPAREANNPSFLIDVHPCDRVMGRFLSMTAFNKLLFSRRFAAFFATICRQFKI